MGYKEGKEVSLGGEMRNRIGSWTGGSNRCFFRD